MSKLPNPNYTQIPNLLLDRMYEFAHPEFKVAMLVCRFTFGFHRNSHHLSLTFFEQGCGLSRETVSNALKTLTAKGWLVRKPHGQSFCYELDLEKLPEPGELVGETDQLPAVTSRGNRPVLVGENDQLGPKLVGETDPRKKVLKKEEIKAVVLPAALDTENFRAAWADWVKYRKIIKHPLNEYTIDAQLKKLAKMGVVQAEASIRQTIENGWQGLFEPKGYVSTTAPAQKPHDPNAYTYQTATEFKIGPLIFTRTKPPQRTQFRNDREGQGQFETYTSAYQKWLREKAGK
jgi:hypothetical protein